MKEYNLQRVRKFISTIEIPDPNRESVEKNAQVISSREKYMKKLSGLDDEKIMSLYNELIGIRQLSPKKLSKLEEFYGLRNNFGNFYKGGFKIIKRLRNSRKVMSLLESI